MLNGELGGALTSSVDFGTVEDIITVNGEKQTKITKLTLKEIIRNAVHLYGGEALHNIIINDLDISGLELLEYRYSEDTPLYLYREAREGTMFTNVTLDGKKVCEIYEQITDDEGVWKKYIDANGVRYEENNAGCRKLTLDDMLITEFVPLINPLVGSVNPATIKFPNEITNSDGTKSDYYAKIAKVSYGDTAGYRYTDLTYAGDLIGNVGESITSILDKIKNMLGDFEYFYDLDG
jgi:hypothetical protein